MNIDELSQKVIADLEKELKMADVKIEEEIVDNTEEELINKIEIISKNKEKELEEQSLSEFEKKYLLNIKERILVLFEALNTKQNEEDLQKRLEITISFIEFLLANIEERLKH